MAAESSSTPRKIERFSTDAAKQFFWLQKHNPTLYRKVKELIADIQKNGALKGIGKPEALKYDYAGLYSRRISREHRLIYNVTETEIIIYSCYTHYSRR